MNEVLCSTGAFIVRANGNNHKLLEESAKRLDFDGYEFMVSSQWYEDLDQIITDIHRMGLHIPVLHSSKRVGEKISRHEEGDWESAYHCFETDCQAASFLNADRVVLHLWGGIPSDRNMELILTAYLTFKAIAGRYGRTLTIENVVCNQKDPLTRMCDLFHIDPDVLFTFDTKMAAFHQQMDLACSEEYAWMWKENHVRHLHINDYSGGYMNWKSLKTLHIGSGDISFDTFFEFLRRQKYQGDYTLEATSVDETGQIEYDKLNQSCQRIREYIK